MPVICNVHPNLVRTWAFVKELTLMLDMAHIRYNLNKRVSDQGISFHPPYISCTSGTCIEGALVGWADIAHLLPYLRI